MAIAAPVLEAEMADWVKLGGGNSGIVGDPNHQYGFHLAANEVPASDYSRWRDPQGSDGPYPDWRWACAGDFSHRGDPNLRAMHAKVLARLMAGELPMICEFIGQPYPDQPVLYWSRWGGLSRYAGAGHDLWSHISWWRSRADERAYLWTTAPEHQEDDMFMLTGSNGTFLILSSADPQVANPVAVGPLPAPAIDDYRAAGVSGRKVNYVNPAFYAVRGPGKPLPAVDEAALAKALAPEVAKLLPKPPTVDEIADELRDRLAG